MKVQINVLLAFVVAVSTAQPVLASDPVPSFNEQETGHVPALAQQSTSDQGPSSAEVMLADIKSVEAQIVLARVAKVGSILIGTSVAVAMGLKALGPKSFVKVFPSSATQDWNVAQSVGAGAGAVAAEGATVLLAVSTERQIRQLRHRLAKLREMYEPALAAERDLKTGK